MSTYIDRVLAQLMERHGSHDQSTHGNWSMGSVPGTRWRLDGVPDHILNGPKPRGKTIRETVASREEKFGVSMSQEALKQRFARDMDALTERERQDGIAFYDRANAELGEHYDGLSEVNEDHGIGRREFFEASAALSIQEKPDQQLAMTRDIGRALASGRYDDMDSRELAELATEVGRTEFDGETTSTTLLGGLTDRAEAAIKIMRGESTLDDEYAPHAQKLRNYANNLMKPDRESGVTMDGWMARSAIDGAELDKNPKFSWAGAREEGTWEQGISVWFSNAVAELADERGIKPHEAQALIWAGIKKRSTGDRPGTGRITPDADNREPVQPDNLP